MVDTTLEINPKRIESDTITILIADDQPLMRDALNNALMRQPDFRVVGKAADGVEAIELATSLLPDVVIMDVSMPRLNGLEATKQIKAKFPNIIVLVLTIHGEGDHVLGMLEAGAAGFLTKGIYGNELANAIRAVVAGETILDKEVARRIIRYAGRFVPKSVNLEYREKLTAREMELIKLVAAGMSNKDIAVTLNLSVRTVKAYLVTIFSKLGVGSRWEAVISGLKAGFLSIDDLTG